MGHLLFHEVLLVVLDGNVQPLIGHHPAFVEGIFLPVPEGHELIVPLELREGEAAHPAHRLDRRRPGPT